MVDLVVRGDTVVTPQGVGAYDVAIAGERIVAMAAGGSLPVPDGARLIDARGKIVMPGGIDPHVHCKWHLPNPDGSAGLTDPPDVVGRAAVHGGTTTMIDFTRASQGKDVREAIETREADWRGHCACDYAQHIMVEGDLPVELPGQLAEAMEALDKGEAQAAFLLRPVTVSQIESLAAARKQMAPKTTYFSPKPRTGMVFRSLDL